MLIILMDRKTCLFMGEHGSSKFKPDIPRLDPEAVDRTAVRDA